MKQCLCYSQKLYAQCCGPFLSGAEFPLTPEQLMRSRFCAYAEKNIDYLETTCEGPARASFNKQSSFEFAHAMQMQNLRILDSREDGSKGMVEFIAIYTVNSQSQYMHERSQFEKIDNKWYYIDGEQIDTQRNDPCYCGSDKKYKKCCL